MHKVQAIEYLNTATEYTIFFFMFHDERIIAIVFLKALLFDSLLYIYKRIVLS